MTFSWAYRGAQGLRSPLFCGLQNAVLHAFIIAEMQRNYFCSNAFFDAYDTIAASIVKCSIIVLHFTDVSVWNLLFPHLRH